MLIWIFSKLHCSKIKILSRKSTLSKINYNQELTDRLNDQNFKLISTNYIEQFGVEHYNNIDTSDHKSMEKIYSRGV